MRFIGVAAFLNPSFPDRSGKSCRLRWCNQLSPQVKHRAFTPTRTTPSFAPTPASSTNGPPSPASSPAAPTTPSKITGIPPSSASALLSPKTTAPPLKRSVSANSASATYFAQPSPSASDSTHTSSPLADPPTSLSLSLPGIDSVNHNTNSPTHSPKFNLILSNCRRRLLNRCNGKQVGVNFVFFRAESIGVMQEMIRAEEMIRTEVRNYMVGLEEQRQRIKHQEKQQHKLIRTW